MQTASALVWIGEAALTAALGVVAFRDGGASTVGWVALLRMLPAVASPVLSDYAGWMRCERVLAGVAGLRFVTIGVRGAGARRRRADGGRLPESAAEASGNG